MCAGDWAACRGGAFQKSAVPAVVLVVGWVAQECQSETDRYGRNRAISTAHPGTWLASAATKRYSCCGAALRSHQHHRVPCALARSIASAVETTGVRTSMFDWRAQERKCRCCHCSRTSPHTIGNQGPHQTLVLTMQGILARAAKLQRRQPNKQSSHKSPSRSNTSNVSLPLPAWQMCTY